MSDVDRLFDEFKATWDREGDADPAAFVAQVRGTDRVELEALIDGFLARAPRRSLEDGVAPSSRAAEVLARLEAELVPAESLVDLRNAAQLSRATLVDRLAAALGVRAKREKVGAYYHELEWGELPPSGVSDRVWGALGEILGRAAGAVRAAACTPTGEGGAGGASVEAFARVIPAPGPGMRPPPVEAKRSDEERWDEVDELFRGRQG